MTVQSGKGTRNWNWKSLPTDLKMPWQKGSVFILTLLPLQFFMGSFSCCQFWEKRIVMVDRVVEFLEDPFIWYNSILVQYTSILIDTQPQQPATAY